MAITKFIMLLVTCWLLRRAYKFSRLVRDNRQHPGFRLIFSPFQLLALLPPFNRLCIPGVIMGHRYVWVDDYTIHEKIGSDYFVLISMFPLEARFIVSDVRAIKEIMTARTVFQKPNEAYRILELYGRNLVTSEGHEWTRQRKVVAPAFSWSSQGPEVKIPVIRTETLKVTGCIALHILSSSAFGQMTHWDDSTADSLSTGHTMTLKEALIVSLRGIPWIGILPAWAWGSAQERERVVLAGIAGRGLLGKTIQKAAVGFSELQSYMTEMIEARRASGLDDGQRDLLSNLIRASDGETTMNSLSAREVTGNIYIFLFAGHETTAHSLAFMFGLLALDPEEQGRLHEHIDSVLGDRQELTYSDFSSLDRVLATFHEALRLYPPVVALVKECTADTTIEVGVHDGNHDGLDKDGRRVMIMKGATINIHIPGVHHNPRQWKDPAAFNPSRFFEDSYAPKAAFLPFSGGLRSCIGQRFSEVEVVAITTLILRQYKVSVDTELFPYVPRETPLQKRNRLFELGHMITQFPKKTPLIFTRR
ncbi:hypothetical protein FRB96_008936 [Tulasnella sp. 330]|nr:hypothetical protein FRB96_008936 [Tulasnella sp. 330]